MRAAIRKLGNSSGVVIPKSMLAELGVAMGDAVDLSLHDGRTAITPSKDDREKAEPKHFEKLPRPAMTSWFGRNLANDDDADLTW
jgi:antitoxin MazE